MARNHQLQEQLTEKIAHFEKQAQEALEAHEA